MAFVQRYISINWSASGGGAFAILPLPSPFGSTIHDIPPKLPDIIPLARTHTAAVLDTAWSPANDTLVASASEDGSSLLWKVPDSLFDGWTLDGWEPQDLEPVARVDVSPKKVGQVLWHPTAANVLATASGEYLVKLWDLADTSRPRSTLNGHGDTIQSIAFNSTGTILATTCRDKKLRLFDPRTGADPVRVTEGHGGIKGTRVVWMGEHDRIATTGFSKMSDRQVSLWETGGLGNVKTTTIDQSAGVIMPFWSDNGILFLGMFASFAVFFMFTDRFHDSWQGVCHLLWMSGLLLTRRSTRDGNIRYYEYESDSLYSLAEHSTSNPQRGMCFLPRRGLEVSECEIARAFKVTSGGVEPIAFIVPRRVSCVRRHAHEADVFHPSQADSFQSDIYPPAPSSEPSLTAAEFFAGKTAPLNLVSLENGAIFAGNDAPPAPAVVSVPPPAPAPAPAPLPEPTFTPAVTKPATTTPVRADSHFADTAIVDSAGENVRPCRLNVDGWPAHYPQRNAGLEEEVDRLSGELREARQKIRNLELQVEGLKANARKAAQTLMEG